MTASGPVLSCFLPGLGQWDSSDLGAARTLCLLQAPDCFEDSHEAAPQGQNQPEVTVAWEHIPTPEELSFLWTCLTIFPTRQPASQGDYNNTRYLGRI